LLAFHKKHNQTKISVFVLDLISDVFKHPQCIIWKRNCHFATLL